MSNQKPNEPLIVRLDTIPEIHARIKNRKNAEKEVKRPAREAGIFDERSSGFYVLAAGAAVLVLLGGCSGGGKAAGNGSGGAAHGGTSGAGGEVNGGGGGVGGNVEGSGGGTGTGGMGLSGTGGMGGALGLGGSAGRSPTGGRGGLGGSAGSSPVQLSAIPGQDPTAVTTSGPQITVLGSQNVKVVATTLPQGLAIDNAGNVIIAQLMAGTVATGTLLALTKFDAQLNQKWSITVAGFKLGNIATFVANNPVAVDSSGNIYVGGESTQTGATGAAVAKFLPDDGTLAWIKVISSSSGTNQVFGVAMGSDGIIHAMGLSSGQLPQQPASASGHGFELAYSGDGTLLRAVQSASIGPYPAGLQVDALGNSFFLNDGATAKVDSGVALLWTQRTVGGLVGNFAVLPDGSGVFDYEQDSGVSSGLVQRDPSNGIAISIRPFGTQTATLNAVEGATWRGTFFGTGAAVAPFMVASNDSMYLAGSYSNRYINGSSPPPPTTPSYVLRLDSSGQQIWFRQFRFMTNDLGIRAMAVGGQDQLVLLGSYGEVLMLKASDGTGS